MKITFKNKSLTEHGLRNNYSIKIGQFRFKFWTGSAWDREPTPQEVLECLYLDADSAEMSYRNFKDEFGYDDKQAKPIYNACLKTKEKILKLEQQGLVCRPISE